MSISKVSYQCLRERSGLKPIEISTLRKIFFAPPVTISTEKEYENKIFTKFRDSPFAAYGSISPVEWLKLVFDCFYPEEYTEVLQKYHNLLHFKSPFPDSIRMSENLFGQRRLGEMLLEKREEIVARNSQAQ